MSHQPELKIPLMTLIERTSAKGNPYWTARLGMSRVIAFRTETPEKQKAIRVFVMAGHFDAEDAADA